MTDDVTSPSTSNRVDGAGGPAPGLDAQVIADRYRVLDIAGTGANTMIVDAFDVERGQPVTVKVVRPSIASSPEFQRSFRRAAEVASALAHPNIAKVSDWGEVEVNGAPSLFWVVEPLTGGSLRDLFDRGRLLDPSQALVVGLEACRGLDAAHQRGLVHTELTPSKLMFGDDRRLRIVDFGMAALFGTRAWRDPATVPTHVARYASPEQALRIQADAKTDVYALSLCLIEAVTGSVPFAGDSTVSTLSARVGKLMPVSADLGPLASVLERAGRPDAEDRFTAAEFGRALVGAAEKLPRPDPIPILIAAPVVAADRAAATSTPATPDQLDQPDEHETTDDDAAAAPIEQQLESSTASDIGTSSPAPNANADLDGSDDVGTEGDGTPTAPLVAAAAAATAGANGDGEASADGLAALLDEPASAVAPTVTPAETSPAAVTTPSPTATAISPSPGASPGAPVEATSPPTAAPTAVAPQGPPPFEPPADVSGEIYDDERGRRRLGPILLIGLVVVIGVAALAVAGWQLTRTKSFAVPDLVGVPENVALNEVAGNGWDIVTTTERSDDQPEPGDVVRTEPAAGVDLDEGETFLLVVSEGPELRTLPDLEDLELSAAQAMLDELRLVLVQEPDEFSETVPAGQVITWQVEDNASLVAGAQVLPDTTIVVTVSKGPEPRPAPQLADLTLQEAQAAVADLQLELVQGEDVFSNDVEIGRVVRQDPAPETLVERGGTVTVQLSKGPDLVPLPDLTGLTFEAAREVLNDAGFAIDSLLGTTDGTFVSLTIGGEPVEPGTTFLRGTGVDVVFL